MKNIFGKFKDESGQALVIVVLSLVVILGATALSVDVGMAFNAKSKLQAAADAAALAGAQDLPNAAVAIQTAKNYAGFNGVIDEGSVIPVTPVVTATGSNKNLIEVTCTQEFKYIFARVLGFDTKTIQVSATAERRMVWGGETLPFLNIDDPVTVGAEDPQYITLWEKTATPSSGDFELLLNNNNHPEYEFTYDAEGNKKGPAINCMLNGLGSLDGDPPAITVKDGINASIDSEIKELCDLWMPTATEPDKFIYILSLASIPDDPLNYIQGQSTKNGNVTSADIPLNNIVLLKCQIVSYDLGSAGTRGVVLKYMGDEPINLGNAISNGTYIPGFANSEFRIALVK